MIVAFTGHRPEELGGYEDNPVQQSVKFALRRALVDLKETYRLSAISGMSLGVDQWAARICLDLQIPYTAAIPFHGQESIWPEVSQKEWRFLVDNAAEKVFVCAGDYAAWKMQKRNEYMVDHADLLIAVFNGSSGGTYNCIEYAEKKGRAILVVHNGITDLVTP